MNSLIAKALPLVSILLMASWVTGCATCPTGSGKAFFTCDPADVEASVGATAVFSVGTKSLPHGVKYQWLKEVLTAESPVGGNFPELRITGVSGDDIANYLCEVELPTGERYRSQKAQLNLDAPIITRSLTNIATQPVQAPITAYPGTKPCLNSSLCSFCYSGTAQIKRETTPSGATGCSFSDMTGAPAPYSSYVVVFDSSFRVVACSGPGSAPSVGFTPKKGETYTFRIYVVSSSPPARVAGRVEWFFGS